MKMKMLVLIGMGIFVSVALHAAAAPKTPLNKFRVALDLAYLGELMGKARRDEAPIAALLNQVLAHAVDKAALSAEINARLMDACRVGYAVVAKGLLGAGADPNYVDEVKGETPLIAAVQAGSLPLVQLLVRTYEVDPHVVGERIFGGKSALSVARELGNAEIIAELEHAGAKR